MAVLQGLEFCLEGHQSEARDRIARDLSSDYIPRKSRACVSRAPMSDFRPEKQFLCESYLILRLLLHTSLAIDKLSGGVTALPRSESFCHGLILSEKIPQHQVSIGNRIKILRFGSPIQLPEWPVIETRTQEVSESLAPTLKISRSAQQVRR